MWNHSQPIFRRQIYKFYGHTPAAKLSCHSISNPVITTHKVKNLPGSHMFQNIFKKMHFILHVTRVADYIIRLLTWPVRILGFDSGFVIPCSSLCPTIVQIWYVRFLCSRMILRFCWVFHHLYNECSVSSFCFPYRTQILKISSLF